MTWNVQINLEKAEDIMLPDIKLYYSFSNQNSTKPAQKQLHTSMEQISEPRNKPAHIQAIDDKGRKNIQGVEGSFFSKQCWETGYIHAKE